MNRRAAPHYHPSAIQPRAQLDPSGAHKLIVETDGGLMIAEYDASQVEQLSEAIEIWRRITVSADGGPDFYNRKVVPIEVRR